MAGGKQGYLSGKEIRRIVKDNRKMMRELEKRRSRVQGTEYLTTMRDPENVVEFDNLYTWYFTDAGIVKSVDGVSFDIPKGKTVGVVGESGCGKSVTSLSLMQLLQRPNGQIVKGSIRLNAGDRVYAVEKTPEAVMQNLRGSTLWAISRSMKLEWFMRTSQGPLPISFMRLFSYLNLTPIRSKVLNAQMIPRSKGLGRRGLRCFGFARFRTFSYFIFLVFIFISALLDIFI